jgi:hypothetical protein
VDELQIVKTIESLGEAVKQVGDDHEQATTDFITGRITTEGFVKKLQVLIGSCREIDRQLKEIIRFTRGAAKRNIKDCIGMSREMVKLMKQSINMARVIGMARSEGVKK